MPELKLIEGEHPQVTKRWAIVHVWSAMLAPEDEDLRSEILFHFTHDLLLQPGSRFSLIHAAETLPPISVDSEYLSSCLHHGMERSHMRLLGEDQADVVEINERFSANYSAGPIEREINKRFSAGHVAGEVLNQLFSYQQDHKDISGTAAISRIADPDNKEASEHKQHARSVKKIWDQFRPVAHFWAATQQLKLEHGESRHPQFPCDGENLPRFLAIAEMFRERAEMLRYTHNNRPVFRSGEAWCVPVDLRRRLPSAR